MAETPLFSLDGRVALVTGTSRGLGYAMAEAMAATGATLVLNSRHADTLEAAARKLRDRGFKIVPPREPRSAELWSRRSGAVRCAYCALRSAFIPESVMQMTPASREADPTRPRCREGRSAAMRDAP
jgi:NAD(P)-dependent dehydrogenase (short-subunit alcohol dehydrogenase family)